jgi:imidazolonepropionase-like amidohydrolase
VVLEGGTIAAVGGQPPGGEAEVLDLQGRTLMPGLIDCHVHLTFSGEPQEVERAATVPVPDIAWTAAASARQTLDGGVTTVRDVGARAGVAIRLREAIAAGRLPGPRMRAAGAIICMCPPSACPATPRIRSAQCRSCLTSSGHRRRGTPPRRARAG